MLCQFCLKKYDFNTLRNQFWSSIKVYIDFIIMWHFRCHNQQIQKSPADFIFPRLFPVTNGTIGFSSFPRIWWYKIWPKKVLLWCQNTFYKVGFIFLVNYVPGTMPSLPIFQYLDSTHFSKSNGIWYMVVGNQHLSRKISWCLKFFILFYFLQFWPFI